MPEQARRLSDADADLARRIAQRDHSAFEALMRRYNGRLFRTARAILKDDAEAEDAVQDAYLDAYKHMAEFRGGAQLGTWLVRIVVNHALMRLRKQKRDRVVIPFAGTQPMTTDDFLRNVPDEKSESPSNAALRAEIRRALEQRIDELPEGFRTVFVLREVEEMTVEETAECLGIPRSPRPSFLPLPAGRTPSGTLPAAR
ncbi:MAG TPA: RNA polymerase sigma factor, partial [Vicinamibacterales bacterium]|nr:RNA polymerase sigma factor [Vicinamibacterales bacterium]